MPNEEQDTGEDLELTEQEKTDGERLAELIRARHDSEEALFTFFESVPEEHKAAVYQYAMEILAAQAQLANMEPTSIQ